MTAIAVSSKSRLKAFHVWISRNASRPHHKIELLGIGQLSADVPDRVDAVRWAFPFKFQAAGCQPGPIAQRQADHLKSIPGRSQLVGTFMGRKRAGDEIDLIQFQLLPHIQGDLKMAEMDRVEGPAEQTDPVGSGLMKIMGCHPKRLNAGECVVSTRQALHGSPR